jgi:hypothetical protein
MPGVSGVTVVTMLVCLFHFAREAAGASSARHSLRPLFSGANVSAQLGRIASREGACVGSRVLGCLKFESERRLSGTDAHDASSLRSCLVPGNWLDAERLDQIGFPA